MLPPVGSVLCNNYEVHPSCTQVKEKLIFASICTFQFLKHLSLEMQQAAKELTCQQRKGNPRDTN